MAYDKKEFEVHNDFVDKFHRERVAFLILDGKVNILRNSTMSHLEWFKSLGGTSEEEFNRITRGYFYQGDLVFYKGNFEYDEDLICQVQKYCKKVCESMELLKCKVHCGLIKVKNEQGFFPPDKFIGDYEGGNLNLEGSIKTLNF